MKKYCVLVCLALLCVTRPSLAAGSSEINLARKEKIYRHIVTKNPHNIEIANALGYALAWQGKYAEAESVFRNSLMIRHHDRDTLFGLASVLFWSGHFAESDTIAAQLLEYFPHDIEAAVLQNKIHDAKEAARPLLTVRFGGLYQDFSFAESAAGGGIMLSYAKERQWALRAGCDYIDKFFDQARGVTFGVSYWFNPQTPLSLDIAMAPNQLVVPEFSVSTQMAHSFNRYWTPFFAVKSSSYTAVDVSAFSVGSDFYPVPELVLTPRYTLSISELPSGTTADHSAEMNLGWNVWSQLWLRAGYAHTEESFESGNTATGQFAAHHVLAGARFNPKRHGLGFDVSIDAENRSNGTTATTVESGVSAAW